MYLTTCPLSPSEGYIQGRIGNDWVLVYLGIIDILQSYRLKKKLEHTMKSFITDPVSCLATRKLTHQICRKDSSFFMS